MQRQTRVAESVGFEASVQRTFDELRTSREIGLANVFVILERILEIDSKIAKGKTPELAKSEVEMLRLGVQALSEGLESQYRLAKYVFILPEFHSAYERIKVYADQHPSEWDTA